MAGESDARRKKILQDLTERSYTLHELVERYGAGESSIKHDIIELRKQGYEIPGGGKKGYRLIASLTEDTDQPVYCESLRQDNLAKLLVLLILQREGKPMNPAEIADSYFRLSEAGRAGEEAEEKKKLRDRMNRTLIPGLLAEKLIRNAGNGTITVSENAPVSLPVRVEDAYDILDQLHYYGPAHPFAEELRSVEEKLSSALINEKDPVIDDTYRIVGKRDIRTSGVREFLTKYNGISFREHRLEIKYAKRDGTEKNIVFNTGLILYAADKNHLYLLGKSINEGAKDFKDDNVGRNESKSMEMDTLLLAERIRDIRESEYSNPWYHSDYFLSMYEEMFSVSTEPVQHVVVEFDHLFNIRTKLERMMRQRPKATLRIRENFLIYEDDIRGIKDFARYLRQYGKSARVKAPKELREQMAMAARLQLERYGEVTE